MASKQYTVRTGFVLVLEEKRPNGQILTRNFNEGDLIELSDEQYALHAHRLEYADKKDIDAALKAERAAAVASAASTLGAADLVALMAQALAAQQAATIPAA